METIKYIGYALTLPSKLFRAKLRICSLVLFLGVVLVESLIGQVVISEKKINPIDLDAARLVFSADLDEDKDIDVLSASSSDNKIVADPNRRIVAEDYQLSDMDRVFTDNFSDFSLENDYRNERTEILYEDFDGDKFLPEGWTISSLSILYSWFEGVFVYNDFSMIDPDHESSALVTSWQGEEKDEWMISPEFDLTETVGTTVSFYVNYDPNYIQFAKLKLNISKDTLHENWTELWQTEIDGKEFEWRRIEVDLSDYEGLNGLKLGWQYVGRNGDVIGVDSIFVSSALQTSINSENRNDTPSDFELSQNYPNPFNPTTEIGYLLHKSADVQLHVYDMLGRKVATLVDEWKPAGEYRVNFEAGSLSSGVYLYSFQADNIRKTMNMTLIK